MADTYIDKDEVQVYGPYAACKIEREVIGLDPIFDAAARHLVSRIEQETAAVKVAVEAARAADQQLRRGARAKSPALEHAFAVMRRFSKHLDGHKPGTVDRKRFFVEDGSVSGVGRAASKVVVCLNRISAELGHDDTQVQGAAGWRGQIVEAAGALAPSVEEADQGRTARRKMTPEVEQARARWLQVYSAAKSVVEGVLRLHGRLDLLPHIFYDLAVPGSMRVTEAPAATP